MYSDRKNHMANMAPPRQSMTTFAPDSDRERNTPRGMSGALASRASMKTNRPRRPTATASVTSVCTSVQAYTSVRTMA